MVSGLFKRLKEKMSGRKSGDIAPPDVKIPTGKFQRDERPLHERLTDTSGTGRPPATGASGQHRELDLSEPEHEPTQEMLKLTDDVIDAMEAEGFDPYNTKDFTNSIGWDKPTSKR